MLVRLFCWLVLKGFCHFSAGRVGPAQTSMWLFNCILLFKGVLMNERASSEWQTSHVSVGDWRAPLIVWLRQEECLNSSTSKLVPAAGLVFVRVCVCVLFYQSLWVIPHRWYFYVASSLPTMQQGSRQARVPREAAACSFTAANSLSAAFVLSLTAQRRREKISNHTF